MSYVKLPERGCSNNDIDNEQNNEKTTARLPLNSRVYNDNHSSPTIHPAQMKHQIVSAASNRLINLITAMMKDPKAKDPRW